MFGSEATVGKSLGTDLANGKLTLPVLVVLERAGASDRDRLRDLVQCWERRRLPGVLELLEKYDALPESRKVIGQFLALAQKSLAALPVSESRSALIGLSEFLVQQTDALGVCP